MVEADETLKDDDPICILSSLKKKVGQGGYGNIGLLCAVKKI
jgi:hypothetical protein